MSLSKLSGHKTDNERVTLRIELNQLGVNFKSTFSMNGIYRGLAIEDEDGQWIFLPVGHEVWYDKESNLFVTFDPARLIESKSDCDVSRV